MAWLLMATTDAISWAPSEENSFLEWLKALRCGREVEGGKGITKKIYVWKTFVQALNPHIYLN